MRKLLATSALLVGLAGLAGGAANGAAYAASAEALAALDPTRAGRFACRGLDASGATLARRLQQAAAFAEGSAGGTAAAPGLYDRLPATDLPMGAVDPLARRYFEQGLALAYGFNHKAAIRSFREAQSLAPDCALCWWGEALANGPNINAGMDDANNRSALTALERAKSLAPKSPALVQDLVAAQAQRYSAAGADRAALDAAYADAMLALAGRYPQSNAIAVLAVEAAMNTTPWNYFDPATGAARPRVDDAVALAEKVMQRSPADPQAAHLYIHLLEAKDPKRAEIAADNMRKTAPPALGHLVHMPSHIYYRLGRWKDSIAANIDAEKADEAYLAAAGDDGIYRFGYYPHNVHFIVTSAQMMGDVPLVLGETAKLSGMLGVDVARAIPWIQAIHAAPSFALAQYATPETTLALTAQPSELAYVEAMRHYARALAHAETGDDAGFKAEYDALVAQITAPGVTDLVAAGFPAPDIVRLAAEVAQGRHAYARGDYAAAVAHYRRAVELQKLVPYNEPPYWYYPVVQSLGAALYAAGDYAGAGDAFRAALFEAPNDGLALYGLAQTERKLGHMPEAVAAEAALDGLWVGDRSLLRMDRI